MKLIAKQVFLILLCAALAGYMRMFSPRLSWGYWPELIKQPVKQWVGALLGAPFVELLYFYGAYTTAGISFFLIRKYMLGNNPGWLTMGLAGLLNGGAWYLIIGALTNSLWRHSDVAMLVPLYMLTGLAYGLFYWRLLVRPMTHAA